MYKKKLAVFDFDDTLYKGQSLNDFLEFIYNCEIGFTRRIIHKLCKQIVRLCHFSSKTDKLLLTLFIKNLPLQKLEQYAYQFSKEIVEKRLNPVLFERLLFHINSDDDVAIVSGGLEIYLQIFSKKHSVEYCIATKIISFQEHFKQLDKECLGNEKLSRILSELSIEKYNIAESYVYTDHLSDIPLLDYFGQGFFVIKENSTIPADFKNKKWNIIYTEQYSIL